MNRRDLMLTAQIDSEGAEPHLVVHGYNRAKEVQQDLAGNGGRIVPVRRLINKRTGEEVNASYEQASNYFEQWKEDGVQELIPYLNEEKLLEWRDAEEDLETANETVGETAARWADNSWRFVKDWGANIGKSLAKIGTHALKSAVGLAQLTAGNQGVGVGIGGMATPQVRHQAAKGSAQMRQALDRVDEEHLDTTPAGYDAEDKGLMEYSYDLVTGGTNLASQLLIGGAVGAATGGTSVPYALMVAAESGGETHAAAMANGKGADQAALLGAGDAAVSYALATLDTVGGSISRAAGPAGKKALGKAFLEGLKRPFTSPAEAAKIARRVGWEVISEMGDTYSHLSFLQGAGVEITQEDKLIASGVAGLYALGASGFMEVGGRIAANSEIKKARKAYAADRLNQANEALQELTPERLKEIEALGEEPITTGQRVSNTEPGGARVVTPRGSVIFADGSEVFADGTIRTPNGVVTNSEGEPITVMPETSDSANVDLFRLIRESDLQVQNIPVDSLKVNDQIVQFKQDADPNTGVVEGERLQGAFNPIPAKPILVMEFADGSREVVTGRHRLDLAKQNNMKSIPANIIYEKDGWTVDAARLMDAYDNILDGKGSDQDFVDFFRNAKLDNRAIHEHPELWSRKRQKDALVVAKGASEDLYTFFMAKDDRLNLETAAAIVSGAPRQKGEQNVKIQRAVLKAVLDNGLRANDAALMTRSLAHAYSQRLEAKGVQQLDLFGEDDTVIMAMGLEAKYAQRKINEINTDLRALKTLLGKQGGNLQARDALLQKYGLESSEDIQGIQNTITKLDGEVNRWKNYFTDPVLAKQAQAYAREVLHLENPVIEVDGEITTVDDRIQETAQEVEPIYDDPNREDFDFAMVNELGSTETQRQYDEVTARFTMADGSKDAATWMRAPNGKPTNLSERQWIHARTPYFKQRFGDWESDPANATKILDENGEPRVMYHGSPEKFTVFSSKKMGSTGTSRGKGYYFTPSKDFASGYADKGGQLYEVFLDIRKPLAYDHRTMTRAQIYKLIDTLDRKLEAVNGRDMGILMDFGDVHVQGRSNVLNEATDLLDNNDSDVDVFAELVNMTNQYDIVANVTYELLGYDGIIPTDTDMEVVALTPNQIKSATDNVGTYSSADDDINYSVIMGEKGAANLNTDDSKNLRVAQAMLNGRAWRDIPLEERRKIKLATGWQLGADGTWKLEKPEGELNIEQFFAEKDQLTETEYIKREQELKDRYNKIITEARKLDDEETANAFFKAYEKSVAELRSRVFYPDRKLHEVLHNDELYQAYPLLREVRVTFDNKLPGGARGYFANNRILVWDRGITKKSDLQQAHIDDIRQTIIHEIQHFIQDIEGFTRGTSPYMFKKKSEIPYQRQYDILRKLNVHFGNPHGWPVELISSKLKQFPTESEAALFQDVNQREYWENWHARLNQIWQRAGYSSLEEAIADVQKADSYRSPYGQYESNIGEVEARNAARRTPSDQNKLLEETEDVSREFQHSYTGVEEHFFGDTFDARPLKEVDDKKSQRLNAYFAMPDGATTIPLTMLRPGKVEKESSIQNAQRFMREAANGLREKRQPIDVVQNEDGTYTIVDGNATAHALSRLGEDAACVRILGKNQGSRLLNSVLIIKPISADVSVKGLGSLPVEQAINKSYRLAKENTPILASILKRVHEHQNCKTTMRKELKSRARALEKIKHELDGDVSKLLGITGGTIILSEEMSFKDVLDSIKKNLPKGSSIARLKKFNFTPDATGYQDVKVTLQFANGGVGEIILISEKMALVKDGIGHRLYELQRTLEQAEEITPEINDALCAMEDMSEACYAPTFDADSFANIKARALDALTRLQSARSQRLLSSQVINLVKSLSSELQTALPPSQDSNAIPNFSLIQNISSSKAVLPQDTLNANINTVKSQEEIVDLLNADEQNLKRNDASQDDINASRGRFNYASTMDISMYGNNGRVPVAGSPAHERGMLPLSLHHVVEMYRLLTGKLPRVVANRSHGMASALGWFNNKTQDIMVRAQLFGLVDKTDITVLHDRLVAKGFFKNEDPTWAANHKEKVNKKHNAVEFERVRSEQELAKEVDKLIEQRIKSGIHQGIGTKVMAHELWHLIDLIDGEAVSKCKERGNLLGHLASLKDSFKKVVADISTANDKQITDECLNFIAQWQGSPDTSHFNNNPAEVYAEMGAAMMLDPERVRTNAPQFYEAFLNGVTKKSSVMDRWVETMDQMRLGVDGNALVARLQKTWTREAEIAHRQVRDAITKPTMHMKWMDTVRILFDRFKPTIMVVQHAQADVRAKLKADLKAGVIIKSDYEAAIARLDKEMVNIRYAKEMFSHQYGRSKLFLIDVNEKVGKIAEKWGVDMQTLNAYMHFKRVSTELQGRATALGVDAPTARKELNAMVQQLGYAQFKRVATLAKVFHALYEQHVLQNPALRQMLGEKRMAYLDKNKHYVTMAHTVDADTVDKVARRLRGEEPTIDPLEVALQDIRSLATGGDRGGIGNVLHRLEGSFRPTVSPLAATAQTAVTLLETAQQNAAIIQVVDALLANNSPDVKILGTGDSRVENARYGTIAFMRDGERITARVPRAVADAINQRNTSIPKLTAAARLLNAAFTTNNFAFAFTAYQRDLDALAINTYGLHRSPLYWLSAFSLGAAIPRKGNLLSTLSYATDVSAYVSAAAQLIPPHIMKSIGENPIGRMLFNRNVSEYWTSYGHKIARIILGGKIEKTLQDAAAARKAGQQTKARELEYCAIMARHVLEDNILLTMNQLRQDDYTKSNLAQLFDKYGLGYDDPSDISPVPRQLFKEIAKGTGKGIWRAATAYWRSAGYVNELASMTNKIAGYCFLHDQQVRGEYDQAHQKEIALQVMDRAGDPNFAARGTIAGMLEMFCSPFWNARREGTMRTLRAAKEHPGNWTAKVLSHAAPRIVSLLISSGLAAYYLRKILGDPSEEELEGTTAGEIIHTFDWMQKAYRNVKPYTLENNRVIPIWLSDDGKTTVSLKIPIPEEAKLADMAINAWWNTNMDVYSPNPERGWSELLKNLGQNIAFDPSSTGTLFTTLSSVLSPYVFGSNPYESYRNAPMYSEDEFKARFEKEGYKYLLKSAGKRIWNNSPLLPLYRFMRTDEPEAREDAQTIRDLLAQPVIGPVLMRFASVDSEGLEQTKQQIDNISERQLAVKRLKAKEHFKHFAEGNPHLIPDEIWNDWDVVRYMMKYAKEGTEDEQKQMIRSMNRITDPRLQKRALELMQ